MKEGQEGILRVDKPVGPTSHDMVGRVRRVLKTRRVGHTGTLDPFASGLLLICVGPATRLSQLLTGMSKSYEAEALLGVRTDTDDCEGAVVSQREGATDLQVEEVEAALSTFRGRILQTPPPYSAKKVGGEAAYLKARRGESVDLAPVEVEIEELELLEWSPPHLRLRTRCSSGTYIRALARDLGEALGVGGHLTALRRTAIGPHTVEGAVSGDSLDDPRALATAWLPVRTALGHLACVDVEEAAVTALCRGQAVLDPRGGVEGVGDPVAIFHADELVALGEARDGRLLPRKVLAPC
jgi:tRNA pseudouridine55 synthase